MTIRRTVTLINLRRHCGSELNGLDVRSEVSPFPPLGSRPFFHSIGFTFGYEQAERFKQIIGNREVNVLNFVCRVKVAGSLAQTCLNIGDILP